MPCLQSASQRSDIHVQPEFFSSLLVVLVSMVVAVFYREDIAQRMLFRDAVKAVEGGQLDRGERILEELLERNPELDEASAFLLRVSGELVLPLLPIERTAVHDHRLGDCTGRLVLHPWGIEFSSRKHVWKWRFEELVTVDRRGARGIFLATREGDMMGLLDTKNYNFSTSGEPLDPETWKRYERLYRDWTRETREPREPES